MDSKDDQNKRSTFTIHPFPLPPTDTFLSTPRFLFDGSGALCTLPLCSWCDFAIIRLWERGRHLFFYFRKEKFTDYLLVQLNITSCFYYFDFILWEQNSSQTKNSKSQVLLIHVEYGLIHLWCYRCTLNFVSYIWPRSASKSLAEGVMDLLRRTWSCRRNIKS